MEHESSLQCACRGACRKRRRPLSRIRYVATIGAMIERLIKSDPELSYYDALHLAQEELGPIVIY